MRPEKLTLRNFGPFCGTHTINFAELGSIFLVFGKTGAGKTTIFDALSYAFYSDAPGGRKGLSRQMRSQLATDEEESVVELEFSLSLKKYRITRTLPFERIGVRSGKTNNIAEEVTLEQNIEGKWNSLSSTNKSDTDAKIISLIGLSKEEFCRIVLLPQGEFSQFLKQNSNERKDVLAKLFPVEQYSRVTALARERAKEMALQLKETEAALVALETQFNRTTYQNERAMLASETDALRAEQSSMRRILKEKAAILEQARTIEAKKKLTEDIQNQLSLLENKISDIEQLKMKILLSRKAEPLLVRYSQLTTMKKNSSRLAEELQLLEKDLVLKAQMRNELEEGSKRIDEIKKEKESLHVRKEQLRIAVDIAGTLDEEIQIHSETKKKSAALQKEIATEKSDQESCITRLAELETAVSELATNTQENNQAHEKLEIKRQLKILSDEAAREKMSIVAHSGALASIREQIALHSKDKEIALAELAELETQKENARSNEAAHTLALRLENGKPCPVCGSLVHPEPASKKVIEQFSYIERIESAKRHCEQLEAKNTGFGKTLAGRESDLRNAEEKLHSVIEKYITIDPDITPTSIPSPEEATESVRTASMNMQKAADALMRSQKAFRESEDIRRRKTVLDSHLVHMQEELSEFKTKQAEQKAAIDQKKQRYREAFPAPTGDLAQSDIIPEASDASEAFEKCAARILVVEAEIHTHEEKLTDAHIQHSSLEGKKSELERSLSDLKKQESAASIHLQNEFRSAGFADENAFLNASFPKEEYEKAEAEISTFNENLSDARTRHTQLAEEIERWKGPDCETAELETKNLDQRIGETDHNLEEKSLKLSTLDSLKERFDVLDKERIERSAQNRIMMSLASDLTGANSAKTSFDAWILGMYLEEITAYANTRLERMSEGRYRIQLNETARKGNNLSGLDLEIRDAYTGKSRPSGTLSGGETFLASISLALGLADSIQSRAGGIQLDAVFIDEGFGSLDESSLERAITILDEIRGTRMVGLISHVAELRTRIPSRIEIVKTAAGSTIEKGNIQ